MTYTILSYEREGTTPDMYWVELSDGRTGLLKPEVSGLDLLCEIEYAAVAEFFGLKVSRCIRLDSGHFVSLAGRLPDCEMVDAYDVAEDNSFELYRGRISAEAYQKLLLMAFVDGVTLQSDRHQGNIAFCGNGSNITDLYPPYDSVACLRNSYSRAARLGPLGRSCTHEEVFRWLRSNQAQFGCLYDSYMSESFTHLAETLSTDSCEILLAQRERVHRCMSAV